MIHGGNVWQGSSPAQWLDYSANIRPEGAPDWVKNALTDAMESISYYPDPEMKRARAALAAYLELPAECVLPAAGGISAIDMAAQLGSERMLQFTPCFAEYAQLSANRGKQIESIPLLGARRQIGDPATQLGDRLSEGGTVWLCNPLNPVGCAFSVEQISRLLARVEEKNGWLVVDEAFIEYCPHCSAAALVRSHERLLITGSMTKILGIPGVRLGYLCAHPRTLERIAKYQLTWEVNCFAEAVLCALAAHREDIRLDAKRNACRRTQLVQGLEALGIAVYPSQAAFVLADFASDVRPLVQALREKGILVRECMNFEGIDDGCHLRLAVKDEASNARLIAAIREEWICAANR